MSRPGFFGQIINVAGTPTVVNPGTRPCEDATVENAVGNMEQFIKDSPCATRFERYEDGNGGDGRFAFRVYWSECPGKDTENIVVDMPGLPLERVRYMGLEGQKPGDFPRLYVGGGSWWWKFGLLDRSWWFWNEED